MTDFKRSIARLLYKLGVPYKTHRFYGDHFTYGYGRIKNGYFKYTLWLDEGEYMNC